MRRREFLGAGGIAAAAGLGRVRRSDAEEPLRWKMVTAWPKNFPGIGTGAEFLARTIGEMSGGRLQVQVYGAGELVPAFEVFDAVSQGAAQMGHSVSYYWQGKNPAFHFFSALPFGMTANEMNSWLYKGGGMELWEEAYAPFDIVPLVAGNSMVQMGGWFKREIHRLEDLQGLRMRIPGLGGEVLRRVGVTPVVLSGKELLVALQTGAIDATEWTGPWNDLAFGLHRAAKYYYYPGWHDPGTTLECLVNRSALEALPGDLQAIVRHAATAASGDTVADFTAHNNDALKALVEEHGVELRQFPPEMLRVLRQHTETVIEEVAASDPFVRKVNDSYQAFYAQVRNWTAISEKAYLAARTAAGV